MSFLQAIRQSKKTKIKHPTQLGFNVEQWKTAFEKYNVNTTEDKSIFLAGLWFFSQFERVREGLKQVPINSVPQSERIQIYIGFANSDFAISLHHVDADWQKTDKEQTVFMESKIGKKIPLSRTGVEYSHTEIADAITDAIKFPLAAALNEPKQTDASYNKQIESHILDTAKTLGSIHHLLHSQWMECLWGNLTFSTHERDGILTYLDPSDGVNEKFTIFRREHLFSQDVMLNFSGWQSFGKRGFKPLNKIPRVKSKNGIYTIYLRSDGEMDEWFEFYFKKECLLRSTRVRLFESDKHCHENLRLIELVDVWLAIDLVAKEIEKHFRENIRNSSKSDILNKSAKIKRGNLVKILKEFTQMSPAKIHTAISYFTFTGDVRSEIWIKPITNCSADTLCLNLIPFRVGDFNRVFDLVIKDTHKKSDLKVIGEEFEQKCRKKIAEHILKQPFFSHYEGKQLIEHNGEKHEIDLLIRCGNSLFLGEAKAFYNCCEPLEEYHLRERLQEGAEQVRLRKTFLENFTPLEIKQTFGFDDISPNFKVVPFIVSEQPNFIGSHIDGVPVIDIFALWHYMENGHTNIGQSVENGSVSNKQSFFKFSYYSTPTEAEENFAKFIKMSPVTLIPKLQIKPRYMPLLPCPDEYKWLNLPQLHYLGYELNTEMSQESLLELCSQVQSFYDQSSSDLSYEELDRFILSMREKNMPQPSSTPNNLEV